MPLTFKHMAIGIFACCLGIAILNLYMNAVTTVPSLRFDMAFDTDHVGFHQRQLGEGVDTAKLPVDSKYAMQFGAERVSLICPGICPPPKSGADQCEFVSKLIANRMAAFPANSFAVDAEVAHNSASAPMKSSTFPSKKMREVWNSVARMVGPRQITQIDLDPSTLRRIIDAVQSARILSARAPKKGSQLKIEVEFDGGQLALLKPRRYGRNESVSSETPYEGFDRHNGEIAAFHLGRLLGLNRVPIAVGRRLKLAELFRIADEHLSATFFRNSSLNNRLCFFGKCLYCNIGDSVCEEDNGELEFAVVLWLPKPFDNLERRRSPWARTYVKDRFAQWQSDPTYCNRVNADGFFSTDQVLLDAVDTAVFDFLIGNGDRHRFELFKDVEPKMLLLMDNGKSFGNAHIDEMSILAPLYQCCRIGVSLYRTLVKYSELNFASLLDRELSNDPVYPILTKTHLEAINRRLRKVLLLVAICVENHGAENVIRT